MASIFQLGDFDVIENGFAQELSYLRHKLGITSIGHMITIKASPDRHFRLAHTDRTPSGEVGGWRYTEITGSGMVLIVND